MNTLLVKLLVPTSLVAAAALAGCAHDQHVAPASATTETTSTQMSAQATPTTTKNMQMSGAFAVCKIDVNNVATAPKFSFDEATLPADERSLLHQIAACVTTGPLKGRQLHLVGRADPRGEQEYNMVLGGSRASTVKSYLTQDGVPAGQITTTSRGKLDATGTDEQGWQQDRRVDIDLK
jgi:peptidoglycan-associated lipoprotein